MEELVKLTKQFIEEEFPSGDFVFADIETCNYFRDHFKKQMNTSPSVKPTSPQQPIFKNTIAPVSPPVPKMKAPTAAPKIEKQPIKAIQTIDHSEFKKMLSDHFPNVSIIDPTSE
jgi:hypothetical protein